MAAKKTPPKLPAAPKKTSPKAAADRFDAYTAALKKAHDAKKRATSSS